MEDAVLAGVMLAAVDGRRVDRHDGDEEEGEGRPHPVHVVSLQGDMRACFSHGFDGATDRGREEA